MSMFQYNNPIDEWPNPGNEKGAHIHESLFGSFSSQDKLLIVSGASSLYHDARSYSRPRTTV